MKINEFLQGILHIIEQTMTKPDIVETYVNIFSGVLTGVIGILGLRLLKPLKDKTITATFTFWSQLSVRLTNIVEWLESDKNILNNMYEPSTRQAWSTLTPDKDRISEFKKIVCETLNYIEKTDDQMPAFIGWSKEYNTTIKNLYDFLLYDIANPDQYFKFSGNIDSKTRDNYIDSVCSSIKTICKQIAIKQTQTEKKLLRFSFNFSFFEDI